MPVETQQAVNWALEQQGVQTEFGIDCQVLVDKVRQYFNTNKITYNTFSYNDLVPYLPE